MQGVQEQRLTLRLQKYWDLIRKTNKMPQIEHFNSAAIEDLWPQCMLVSADARFNLSFRYEYIGDYVVQTYGRDLSGQVVESNNIKFPGGELHRKLCKVISEPAPANDSGHCLNERGDMMKYRACFLPFGTESKGVTHILVGLSFRAF